MAIFLLRKKVFSSNLGWFLPVSDTNFLQVIPRDSLNLTTEGFFRVKKKSEHLYFYVIFLKPKQRSVKKKKNFSDKFGMQMPGSYTYFLEVIHTCQKRKSSKILLKVKKQKT